MKWLLSIFIGLLFLVLGNKLCSIQDVKEDLSQIQSEYFSISQDSDFGDHTSNTWIINNRRENTKGIISNNSSQIFTGNNRTYILLLFLSTTLPSNIVRLRKIGYEQVQFLRMQITSIFRKNNIYALSSLLI